MDYAAMLNATGAAIVLGGTLLATLLGSGRRELAAMLGAIGRLFVPRFRLDKARAEIARDVEAIRHDGLLRALPCHSSDREIAAATDALVHDRSINSLILTHKALKKKRVELRELALRPLLLAAEMAPVFGMVGTLFGLAHVPFGEVEDGAMLATVGLAVLTTLYGLLLAHLLFNPLARLIARRGAQEDEDRQQLVDWLARQIAPGIPKVRALDAAA
ncbi:MAG: MotA/TolQ/ExbB proton channel family protein [Erythrobacter sp.]|nr:MAG: MotA/TolQ/ExbB proton channel family protein [Erythrobacter sp.]